MIRRLLPATLLTSALIAGALPAAGWAAGSACPRLAGSDRVETAVAVADHGWDTTDTVVIATRAAYPDALAASPLAGHREAPILYVDRDRVPSSTATALEQLEPREVVIVGGDAAVSPVVAQELRSYASSVVRLAGRNRYETAAVVATASELPTGEAVVVAVGDDAAAAAGHAARGRLPLLLATPSTVPSSTRTAFHALGTTRAIVVGATPEVTAALGQLGIETVLPSGPTEPTSFIAAATAPDLLAAAPLAARTRATLVSVERDEVPAEVADLVAAGAACAGVVGGHAVVSDAVVAELATVPVGGSPTVLWRTPDGSTFRTTGHDDDDLARIEAALGVEGGAGIPNGRLEPGDGGVNVGHEWHLVDVELVDVTIEVCDGNASDIDEDLDYWLETVGHFCPWAATPLAIER